MTQLLKRKDVAIEDTWKLEDIFESDDLAKDLLSKTKERMKELKKYEGELTSSSEKLYEALHLVDDLSLACEKLYVYFNMRLHQDSENTFYQDLASRSENVIIELGAHTSFVEPEISSLTEEKLDSMVTSYEPLKLYRRYFSELFRMKKHILDSKSENILSECSMLANTPSNIYSMFNNADIKFPTIDDENGQPLQITHGRFIQLLESKNERIRRESFKAVYSSYSAFKNTLATTFASNIKQYGLFAKLRQYDTPMHRALSANNIPTSVYTNLIDCVNDNLDLLHNYIDLRKKILGFDELHIYDLYMPIVNEFDKKISYDEACETILKALEPMGQDYVELVKKAFSERWVDKYENQGKKNGAYSWGSYDTPHPYVLMNYVDNVSNMFTLAHEIGHAIHSYMSHHTQPYPYAHYCIFVAEVASTVNEALLMQYLLKTTTDKAYREYLINYFMEQFRQTLYRQTMFAEFEKSVHETVSEGGTLTPDLLCDTYYNLVKKYHGDNMHIDEEIGMEWSRIPHFYTPFYVYQYATGYSAAITLSKRILDEGETAVTDYKTFLSGGSSKDPIDLLKMAGVDMSSNKPIEEALQVFDGLIKEMYTFVD